MRILVVEDERKVASFIQAGLREQGFLADVCHDGNTALRTLSETAYDAAVLDIMLPGLDGLAIVRRLREARNTLPIVLLTARGGVTERIEGLELGADDYLAKPFSMQELVARLRAVLRRRTGDGLPLQTCGDLVLNPASREVRRAGVRLELTPREFALLEVLLRTLGRPVTRVEIAQSVWGLQFDSGTNVVDVAIQRLRRKVDAPFPVKLIQTVRSLGYSIQAPSTP